MTKTSRYIIWGSCILVIVLVVWGMVSIIAASNRNQSGAGATLKVPVTEADWIQGSASSTTTLVEYSDFQCPACGAYYPLVTKFLAEHGQEVRFIYRHFPLITVHANAQAAAQAAEAAGRQGAFWPMYGKLFSTQDEWSLDRDVLNQHFVTYAKDLGLNTTQFTKDFDDRTARLKINEDFKSGRDSGVIGTPTFFVNGIQIQNPQSYEAFVAAVLTSPKNGTTTPVTTPILVK